MSEKQKQTWSGYLLMFGVFTLIFSTLVPAIVTNAVDNISSVPVIIERLDSIDNHQKEILKNQDTAMIERIICQEHSKVCNKEIVKLQGYHND